MYCISRFQERREVTLEVHTRWTKPVVLGGEVAAIKEEIACNEEKRRRYSLTL